MTACVARLTCCGAFGIGQTTRAHYSTQLNTRAKGLSPPMTTYQSQHAAADGCRRCQLSICRCCVHGKAPDRCYEPHPTVDLPTRRALIEAIGSGMVK